MLTNVPQCKVRQYMQNKQTRLLSHRLEPTYDSSRPRSYQTNDRSLPHPDQHSDFNVAYTSSLDTESQRDDAVAAASKLKNFYKTLNSWIDL